MNLETMRARSRLVTLTRDFSCPETISKPIRRRSPPTLIPESCLEAFATNFVHPYKAGFPLYLIPSPEIWMKRIIAATGKSVFQLCKSFRNAESLSRIHNPEFTILEYYTIGATSHDNIGLTEELFTILATGDTPMAARAPFRRITMAEAFADCAGLDLGSLRERGAIIDAARSKGLMVNENSDWEDAFNIIFLSLVEPLLPADRPLVLDEYPCEIECLAKDIPGRPYKERWELYVKGIEIANCFTEMGSPEAVKKYFASQGEKKLKSLVPHRIDPGYPALFADFPPCSGVAIGFDRLAMVLLDLADIAEVMTFPFSVFPLAGT